MTDQIRAAAQALLAAWDTHRSIGDLADRMWDLRTAMAAPQPAADERVAEHMQTVRHVTEAGTMDELHTALTAVQASARALLAAGREDAELFNLLDIAAHHFTEGHYGWPSTDTRAAILAHWRAGKPPVPSVFEAELLQAINDPNRDEGAP